MLHSVHLVGEEEDDDIYGGFNDYEPAFATEKSKVPGSSMGRPTTGIAADTAQARPMTAVRSVGYSSSGNRAGTGQFDPLNQTRGPAPPLESKSEDSPEEKVKQLEKKVNELIEESCIANDRGELALALEKAKEAGRKERSLCRQREQTSLSEQMNLDLTYSVLFNLASQYHANKMFNEALNTYQVIVKNKMFSNAGRLRVNMGNIYFEQKKYPQAIKHYRMALDQVPTTHREMRIKIMQNIGVAFVKMGQYSDSVTSFEHIMAEKSNFQTGFNLILCYYGLGDRDKMKKTFQKLLTVDLGIDDEDKYTATPDDNHQIMILEVIRNDKLREIERKKKSQAEKYIMSAAKLISPAIENNFAAGFDWCIECVKVSPYMELANELEITKAITYLKQKDLNKAVECLKGFEKKDSKVQSTAATDLSFLYYLENDITQADKYAELAMAIDRYNPAALVNKGNCLYSQGEYEKAREFYQEAYNVEATCTEALYNLGLVYKKLGQYEDALDCFTKLHAILRNHPQVIYQLANLYMQLVSVVPTDPFVLAKLGEIYDNEQDKSQAFQYHYESYRYFPSNIDIISWLGAYYIDSQFCEKAIHYFERAAIIQPNEVKWQLMIASCYRRSGNYQQALETYRNIHHKFPDNVECLKFLVRICTDLGLKDVQEYAQKLKKAEKARELKEQRASSGSSRKGSGRGGSASQPGATGSRNSSAGSDATYSDPLGEAPARPKTAGRQRHQPQEDEFLVMRSLVMTFFQKAAMHRLNENNLLGITCTTHNHYALQDAVITAAMEWTVSYGE
ncbi:hypothetical protein QZH41_001560 [Actinostola sp. cb2023]|nr:hypothetical protein QZH41_001560 [Actinostola sp. cb2023]